MKRILILYIIFIETLIFGQNSRMIIPSELAPNTLSIMKEMGMNLNAEDIYSSEKPSMNDAVVQFNGGCTGEIVSSTGLLFTNHHCGYSAIQSHSTFEHNYIKDGFWAMSNKEELPNPGMYVTFVRNIKEVTKQVLEGVSNDMDNNLRKSVIQKNINKLEKTLPKKDWQEIEIKPFYAGNKYFAFTNENYYDIRLVGAPPSSIGKFGADTDNWMWPRHSGDFSIFRIYADKNNHPAKYSKDNVPYKTNKFFKISIKPMQPGEFFIIYGFPGRTNEYLPAVAVDKKVNIINPARTHTRKIALDVIDKYMQKDDTIKLKYTAKYARIANYWKKWIGESQGINKTNAIKKKQLFEQEFLKKVKEKGLDKSYLEIFEKFNNLYTKIVDAELARNYFIEITYINNDLLKRAFNINRLLELYNNNGKESYKNQRKKYQKLVAGSFKNYDAKVDKELFIELMNLYINKMPKKHVDKSLKTSNIKNTANIIYSKSVLNNEKELEKLYQKNPKKFVKIVSSDPGFQFAKKLINTYYNKINPDYSTIKSEISQLQKKYMKGIIAISNVLPYPDANGTLRISYGTVQGYEPYDAVLYFSNTTLKGVIEKYIPGDYEFDVDKKLLNLYKKKDYKPYSKTGFMPVDFLGSAHTTGGNSGSPAINKEGELIGINFDRVWEGTMSDLYYDRKISRNIMVDIKYVLFIIDKFGNDKRLIKELTIIK